MDWKHRSYLLIFRLELEIFDVAIQKIHQNSKKWWLCQELLRENDFETVNFCCYDYGVNASEAVQKISTRTLIESWQLNKTANFIAAPASHI